MILMPTKIAQNPLILHYHRLMEAFAKSDDERDFYLDKREGFLVFVDLDKDQKELEALEKELNKHSDRYCLIPKLTFYETKKIMESFVNEKVFDIDTKEKLMDIIQSKEAREHFLEFIYDHHTELEKWQQFYQERFRIRIIEWLRNQEFKFVFEEDLDMSKSTIENLKHLLFQEKVGKDIANARQFLESKSKTYYSSEALNPRPKRGRPPKQAAKIEIEPKLTADIYTTIPPAFRPFHFAPEITNPLSVTFSSKFENEEELLANLRSGSASRSNAQLQALNEKLESLRSLSTKISRIDESVPKKDLDILEGTAQSLETKNDLTKIDKENKSSTKKISEKKTSKSASKEKSSHKAPTKKSPSKAKEINEKSKNPPKKEKKTETPKKSAKNKKTPLKKLKTINKS